MLARPQWGYDCHPHAQSSLTNTDILYGYLCLSLSSTQANPGQHNAVLAGKSCSTQIFSLHIYIGGTDYLFFAYSRCPSSFEADQSLVIIMDIN